jgi:hypothetical protein
MKNLIKTKLLGVIIVIGILLLAAVLVGSGLFLTRILGAKDSGSASGSLLARPPSTMVVQLTGPVSNTRVDAGAKIPVYGQMTSNYPVARLELWVNGAMVEKRTPPQGTIKNYFIAHWNWSAPGAGVYKMNLRGVDRDGHSAVSNLVVVMAEGEVGVQTGLRILPTPDRSQLTPVPTLTPDPALNIPGSGESENSGQPASGGAPGGATGGNEEPPESAPNPKPPSPPNPDPGAPDQDESGEDQDSTLGDPPTAPSLGLLIRIESEGCTFIFNLADKNHNAQGFFIERSGPEDNDFTAITMVKADPTSNARYVDNSPKQKGIYLYNIIAFNADTGMQVTEQKKAVFEDNSCNRSWNGVVFADMKLVPRVPVNQLYCYAWLNELPWERLPAAEASSIPAMGAEDLVMWNGNLNMLTKDLNLPDQYNFSIAYDLTPFAPDLSQTGLDNFQFSIKCLDFNENSGLKVLGVATRKLDLKEVGQLIKMPADSYDLYIYFSSKVMSGDQPGYNLNIARPFNLEVTTNPNSCAAEIRGLCEQYIQNNNVVFKWEWVPEPCLGNPSDLGKEVCVDSPTGFRFYRLNYPDLSSLGAIPVVKYTDGHYYNMIAYPIEELNVDQADSYEERQSKLALMQKQYTVRAVYANAETGVDMESWDSNWVQLKNYSDQFEPRVVVLDPDLIGHYIFGFNSIGGNLLTMLHHPANPAGVVDLGFANWAIDSDYAWALDEGYFKFDLSSLMGKQIISATLNFNEMKEDGTVCYSDGSCYARQNCAQALTAPSVYYPPGVIVKSDPPTTWITHSYVDKKMDVTNQVRIWTEGSEKNYGFMLGSEQTYVTNDDQDWTWADCRSTYGPVQLEIKYDDKP